MIKSLLELKMLFQKGSPIFDDDDFTITFTFPTETKARIAANLVTRSAEATIGSWAATPLAGIVRQLGGINIKFAWSEQVVKINAGEV